MNLDDDIYFVDYDIFDSIMTIHFYNGVTKKIECTIEQYINFDNQLKHDKIIKEE